jgi:chromate transporter
MDETPPPDPAGHPGEVFAAFFRQGLTAFGGPAAQAAALRREFVDRRGWLSDTAFADLFAMAQFLPGPSSSALGMAIGLRRAGLSGLLAAGLGFALPIAAAMIGLAYLLPNLDVGWGDGMVHGLKLAAAALVAQAVVALARPLAGDPIRAGIAIGATAGLVVAHGPVAQISVLSAGAVFGVAFLRPQPVATPDDPAPRALPAGASMAALTLFVLALGLLPFLAGALDEPMLGLASVAYRAGALAFGDGQALLPLLHGEVVTRGWMERDTLLAGWGAVNALPGPSLGLAGFVGSSQAAVAGGGWAAGVVALVAAFAPSVLLVAGVAPFWDRLKLRPAARSAVGGVNAAAVGLLAAALWSPVLTGAIERPSDWLLAIGAFVFLAVARLPAWLVVVGFAAAMGLFHPPLAV